MTIVEMAIDGGRKTVVVFGFGFRGPRFGMINKPKVALFSPLSQKVGRN